MVQSACLHLSLLKSDSLQRWVVMRLILQWWKWRGFGLLLLNCIYLHIACTNLIKIGDQIKGFFKVYPAAESASQYLYLFRFHSLSKLYSNINFCSFLCHFVLNLSKLSFHRFNWNLWAFQSTFQALTNGEIRISLSLIP